MANQKGVHLFTGKISTSVGYNKKGDKSNRTYEKGKGGPSLTQFQTLPSMAVNRTNAQEFEPCNWYSKNKLNIFSNVMTQKGGSLRIELMKLMMKRIKVGPGVPGERLLNFSQLNWISPSFQIGSKPLKAACSPLIFVHTALPDYMMDVIVLPQEISLLMKKPRFATHYRFIAYLTEFCNMEWDAGLVSYRFVTGYVDSGMSSFAGSWYPLIDDLFPGEMLSPPQINFSGVLTGCTCLILEIQFAQFNGISPCLMTGNSYASVIGLFSY